MLPRMTLHGSLPQVCVLALGTMQWGEGPLAIPPDVSREILEVYLNLGGNVLDTAPLYGERSSAEQLVGELIATRRHEVVLVSKVGGRVASPLDSRGLSRRSVMRGVHDSLIRLQTDYLDVILCHAWDEEASVEGWVEAMETLMERGEILGWGVSNFPAWAFVEAALSGSSSAKGPVVVQMPYSVIDRQVEVELLPASRRLNTGVMAYSPLSKGDLAGRFSGHQRGTRQMRGYPEPEGARLQAIEQFSALAQTVGIDSSVLALSWLVAKGVQPVLGVSGVHQLQALSSGIPPIEAGVMDIVDRLRPPDASFYPHDFIRDTRDFFFS